MGRKKEDNNLIRNWVIYKITSPTNRIYIGKAASFKERIGFYKNVCCKQQVLLYNSLSKYGYDAHNIEQIDSFSSDNRYANGKEIFWIRTYMSNHSKYPEMRGMNLTDGGEGTVGRKATESQRVIIKEAAIRRERNPEYKKFKGKHTGQSLENIRKAQEKLRASPDYIPGNTGKKHSESAKNKMSIAKIGKPSWNKGIPMSIESRIKLSNTNKGKVAHNKGVKLSTSEISRRKETVLMNRLMFRKKGGVTFRAICFQRRVFKKQDIKHKIA